MVTNRLSSAAQDVVAHNSTSGGVHLVLAAHRYRPYCRVMTTERTEFTTGLGLGLASYVIWGLVPLYFKLLHSILPWEIVAHRVIWSVLLLVAVLVVRRQTSPLINALKNPLMLRRLGLSSLLIATNWLIYIWAVTGNHLLAASLGYFLNPLVNVVLGVTVLGERLTRAQILAITIAGVGVTVAAFGILSELWISIALALSFGCYGLIRKTTAVGAIEGLTVETLLLAPFCLAGLAWLAHIGQLGFGANHVSDALLIFASVVTSLPLILFAAAARKLPYATMGLLQYIAPTMVFLIATFIYHEPLHSGMVIAFGCIWLALAIFTTDLVRTLRLQRARPAPSHS